MRLTKVINLIFYSQIYQKLLIALEGNEELHDLLIAKLAAYGFDPLSLKLISWWPHFFRDKIQGYFRTFKDIFSFFQGSEVSKFQDIQGLKLNFDSFSRIFKDHT